jgi:ATP-dependent protease HslVU (ClpYQ) peptidase subunit
MTCIVGLNAKGKIWIGGDSAGVDSDNMMRVVRKDPKVFKLANGTSQFIVGYAGSFRFGQIMRYKFTPPDQTEGTDDYAYLVTDFMDALRTATKEAGFTKVDDSVESFEESSALLGFNGKLYTVEEDLQVGEMALPYCALGCGSDFAFGSMETSFKLSKRMSPRKRIQLALEAAAVFSAGVCPPFTIQSL